MAHVKHDLTDARPTDADRVSFIDRMRRAHPDDAVLKDPSAWQPERKRRGAEVLEALRVFAPGDTVAIGGTEYRVKAPSIGEIRRLVPVVLVEWENGKKQGASSDQEIAAFLMVRVLDDSGLGLQLRTMVAKCFGQSAEWFDELDIAEGLRAVEVAVGLFPLARLREHFSGLIVAANRVAESL